MICKVIQYCTLVYLELSDCRYKDLYIPMRESTLICDSKLGIIIAST